MAQELADIELAQLRLFVQVAELGSLTKAAVMLDTAQPAISRQISALEHQCGGRLFHRTGRGVALTELGQRVLPRVKALLLESRQLQEDIRATASVPSGEVIIGILPSLSLPLIERLFAATRERFPGIHLRVLEGSTGQVDEWLVSGRIDVAMLYRYGKGTAKNETPLASVDTYLVGPKGDSLTRAASVTFEKLHQLPLVLPGAPNALRVLLDQIAKKKGIELKVAIEADSIPLQRQLSASSGCYTLLPIHAVAADVDTGRLQAAQLVSPGIVRAIALGTTTQRPLTAACHEMTRLIRATVDEIADDGTWRALRRTGGARVARGSQA